MRRLLGSIALCAVVACLGATPSWRPSIDDLVALKHLALEHGAPVHYFAKSPTEMPPWDPIVFYPGDLDPGWIDENRGADTSSEHERALHHALILAAMDMGTAGEQWKRYYDALEAQDHAQSRNAPDPYHFRHAFLRDLDAKIATRAPAFPPAANDAALDADAARVTDHDLSLVTRGYYATPVSQKASALPSGMLARYDGKLGLGNYVIERSSLIDDYEFAMDTEPPGTELAYLGAYFQAIVDSGAAGPELKQRYDLAADKVRFGLVLSRAYELSKQRMEAQSRATIAWIRSAIHPGMSRQAVDALLKTRSLVLYYSKLSGTIEFPIRSSFVCGTSIAVIVTLDQEQRVTKVTEQPPYTACM